MIMGSTELAVKRQIEDVLKIKNECLEHYKTALDEMQLIRTKLNTLDSYLAPSQHNLLDADRFRVELDKNLWNYCFDKLGVFTVMNSKNIDKIRDEIKRNPIIFNADNVESTVKNMYENRSKYFVEGIIETFGRLSRDHKTNTNDKFKIPDKCIIQYMIEPTWQRGFRINYSRENNFADIHRTFCILDKQPFEPRQAICDANAALEDNDVYENEYIKFKAHKNGNAHITFKRIDLLDKANQLIADYYGNVLK